MANHYTIKPARYLMVGFKNLQDSQTNNNNILRVAMNQTRDPIIRKVQRLLDLERIDKSVKEGGFLPFLHLIFAGLAAAAATAGGAAEITQAINAKKAADAEKSEQRRHNMEMEKIAQGSGVVDILGTVKEFGIDLVKKPRKLLKRN
ncbi:hypothetical protein LOTGIDRAFT_153578 [Lottia gigantea]|uniref:Uncharacterized protein n=1 Tax=Lottia gigantea TaxID=225164 RepID=V3ZIN2_LOTGI|nr:hypothetical protein LOTGIDRAFT_153578 [Lottia gigantea]ESO91148.1 hypothetical protein LOTGIDRAFT_153578 [Lottia gigantea]